MASNSANSGPERKRQCTYVIKGPKIDRAGNVAWRKRCKNLTNDPSGKCHFHREAGR